MQNPSTCIGLVTRVLSMYSFFCCAKKRNKELAIWRLFCLVAKSTHMRNPTALFLWVHIFTAESIFVCNGGVLQNESRSFWSIIRWCLCSKLRHFIPWLKCISSVGPYWKHWVLTWGESTLTCNSKRWMWWWKKTTPVCCCSMLSKWTRAGRNGQWRYRPCTFPVNEQIKCAKTREF